jgi:hypothetical protein
MPVFRHSRVQLVLVAAAAVGLYAADAFAGDPPEPGLQILVAVGDGDATSVDPGGTFVSGSLFNYAGSLLDESGWSLSWNLNADADPFINGNLAIENLTLNTLEFDILVLLPTGPIGPSTLIGGSAAFGLTTNSDGGTLSTAGGPAWEAMIDNAVVASLFPHPTSSTLPGLGSVGFSGSFGTPIPSMAGPAVLAGIGIHLHFTLTPGDQASVTSVFVVNQVPGPAALALIGVGLVSHRRRR